MDRWRVDLRICAIGGGGAEVMDRYCCELRLAMARGAYRIVPLSGVELSVSHV